MDKRLVLTSRKNRGILQEAVIENSLTEAKQDEQRLIDFAGDSLAKRFLSIKKNINFDYDSRGWITSTGKIISTNNAPHYEKEHEIKDSENLVKYNFGYERYIGLPENRLSFAQYETLTNLLDYFFINKPNVGERSTGIEINYDMNDKGDFKWKFFSPKTHTTDDIIKLIKRYYTTGRLNESSKNKEDIDSSINEAVETNSFTPYTAGYILEDGSLLVMDEYHGEEEIREFYPEYSNTHPEEDTCVRLYSRPNEAQYKRLEEIIDYYLNHENYCKVEIWNKPNGKYTFYEVYSLYEGACKDTTWNEKIGNWTGYKLVQVIKNYFAKRVIEAMKAKENISNPLISKYIKECIAVMKQIKFGFKEEEKILTYDDIDAEEGSTISTFGVMSLPTRGSNNFKLVLNKHMFTESEEAIKNTIYHELCHYVVSKIAINLDIIYTKNGKWYHNRSSHYNFSDFKGHGYQWKRVANIVGRATKQSITRTNTYDVHTGVGAHAETKYKYIVKCKNCSKEFKYTKRTKFINAVLAGNGYTENWWCNCSDGRKGHYFEIVKGNN